MANFQVFRETSLPAELQAYSLYFVAPAARPDHVEVYVTGATSSIVKRVIDTSDVQTLIDSSIASLSAVEIVADITERDALAPEANAIVLVLDATDDSTVVSGAATYAYRESTDTWTKISEAESLDVVVDWTNIVNKPDPQITVTLSGDVTGTANTTLSDLSSGTISIATTIEPNSVALGTDTTGAYVESIVESAVPGTASGIIAVNIAGTEGSIYTISHGDTSSQESVDNADGNVIQDISLDGFGHLTSINSVNLDDRYFTETEADARFLGINAKADDSDLLDGQDSAYYLAWANLTEKPTSSVADIDDAVSRKHSHANIAQLDKIGEDANGNLTYNGALPVMAWGSTNW
jgi:hypothetical protein